MRKFIQLIVIAITITTPAVAQTSIEVYARQAAMWSADQWHAAATEMQEVACAKVGLGKNDDGHSVCMLEVTASEVVSISRDTWINSSYNQRRRCIIFLGPAPGEIVMDADLRIITCIAYLANPYTNSPLIFPSRRYRSILDVR